MTTNKSGGDTCYTLAATLLLQPFGFFFFRQKYTPEPFKTVVSQLVICKPVVSDFHPDRCQPHRYIQALLQALMS